MSFAQCRACKTSIRVWDAQLREHLPEPARAAADAAFVSSDRTFRCPSCGRDTHLPFGSVYVIFDGAGAETRFVGRSRDAVRRIAWWKRPGASFADARFIGVPLVTLDKIPSVEWLAHGYASLNALTQS